MISFLKTHFITIFIMALFCFFMIEKVKTSVQEMKTITMIEIETCKNVEQMYRNRGEIAECFAAELKMNGEVAQGKVYLGSSSEGPVYYNVLSKRDEYKKVRSIFLSDEDYHSLTGSKGEDESE